MPGVPVFFLISGYLIAKSYDRNPCITDYIINRMLRILPALYVCFLISLAVVFTFGYFDTVPFKEIIVWSFAQLSFIQFYNPDFLRSFGVGVLNGSLWTISVEICFYILLPVLAWQIRTASKKTFITLFILSISFLSYFYFRIIIRDFSSLSNIDKLFYVSILPYLFYFTLGMLFYYHRLYFISFVKKNCVYIFLLYLSLYLFPQSGFLFFMVQKIIFSFFVFSIAFNFVAKSRGVEKWRQLDLTYGIYIYHMLVINVFVELNFQGDIVYVLYAFGITVILAILSFYLVEKPFLFLKKRAK